MTHPSIPDDESPRIDTAPTRVERGVIPHPLGSSARVLLCSVFGPYARDDAFGSREVNPMELYHHQVTREQGGFSIRTFHRSWGLMLIQANLDAPCTLLDYPTRERFEEELRTNSYDVIGISGIPTNLMKVRRMCRTIRKLQPEATVVVGGHIANVADLGRWCDLDHAVRGEGVRWMRKFLGQDPAAPVRHPRVLANFGTRIMGVPLRDNPADKAATLIPAVGCPMGCNFCSTSAMFGGRGSSFTFMKDAAEIFEVMCDLASSLDTCSFFVMDENFLHNRKRALQLLELMEEHHKPWSLYVFSSANVLRLYSMDELVRLGIAWVWIGLEGKSASYGKLRGVDTRELVADLQAHGVRVLGSSIIGLEEHTPENIDEYIDHAVSHCTELHQFMLYTPTPGTPLFEEHLAAGTLKGLDEVNISDIHGQGQFSFHHAHIKDGQEGEFLNRAFRRDFEVNGPSLVRIARTTLRAWRRFRDHPDPRIVERFASEASVLPDQYAGIVWAAREIFADQPELAAMCGDLLEEFHDLFGAHSRRAAPIVGRYLLRAFRREEERLASGWAYEPPTFCEQTQSAVEVVAH